MYRLLFALFFACSLACTSGGSKSAESNAASISDSAITQEPTAPSNSESAPPNEEIQELGLLKEVEDSGYPFAVLTIEFPERKFSEYFTINFEEVKGASLDKVREWTGKYVSFRYTSELENALLDVQANGKSLVDPSVDVSRMKKVEGVLKGADEETPGDLPGKITITAADNTVYKFDFFVTAEMVKANNSQVIGYYEERTKNVIKAIKKADK